MFFDRWLTIFINLVTIILIMDMQHNKLSRKIDNLTTYLDSKIKESEQSIINAIGNIKSY